MIVFILIIAFLLRLVNLNQSLWLDEAVQALTAQKGLAYIFQEIKGDFHPPLYHFLMHFWVRLFGVSEISLRFPSVLAGVGTVFFAYLLGREIFKKEQPALLAALFLATASFHIYYSQEARMYSLVTFWTAGSFYFFVRLMGESKWKERAGYFLFTLLALYTDYYAFLILLAQGLFLAVKRKWKHFLFWPVFLVFYLPWLPMFIGQLETGMAMTRTLPEWGKLISLPFTKALPLTLVKFTLGRITIFDKKLYFVLTAFIFVFYSFVVINLLKSKIKNQKSKLSFDKAQDPEFIEGQFKIQKFTADEFSIFSWFLIPLLFAWIVSLWIPNYQPFRLLLVLPAFYLLLAKGVCSIKNPKISVVVTVFILALNFASLAVYYFNPYFWREDWRGLVNFLKKHEEVAVILPSQTSAWPVKYYDRQEEIRLITPSEGIGEISESREIGKMREERIFYIRYLVPLFDPKEVILKGLKQKGYTKVGENSFNQIPVWEFEKK